MKERKTFFGSKKTEIQKRLKILRRWRDVLYFPFRRRKVRPIFAYLISAGVIAVGVIFAVGLIVFLNDQVSEQAIKQVEIRPSACTGWNNASGGKDISNTETSGFGDFSPSDSAFFKTLHDQGVNQDALELSESTQHSVICSGFSTDRAKKDTHDLKNAEIIVSLGTQATDVIEDIVSISYSLDGALWHDLDSFMVDDEISNKTNGGYWHFPIQNFVTLENLSKLQLRVTYHSVSTSGSSIVYLDGLALSMQVQKKIAVPPLPEDVVRVAKGDFALTESPSLRVKTKDASLLSLFSEPDQRTIQSVTILDPTQETVDAHFATYTIESGMDTEEEIQIPKEAFTKPGRYTVRIAIEHDGMTETVEQNFLWGVLAVNVRQSITTPGSTQELGFAVLDNNGTTICNADLLVTVTHPSGFEEKMTTENSTVVINDTCVDQSVTNEPDYSAFITPQEIGTYMIDVEATTTNGTHVISDSFEVRESLPFLIERTSFPTRIFPPVPYRVVMTVTAFEDYTGVVREPLPVDFEITDASNDGQVVEAENGGKSLEWNVTFKEGETYELAYIFKAPNISPEFYELGPLLVGSFSESRSWKIAGDMVSGITAPDTQISAAPEKQAGGGSRNVVYAAQDTVFIFYIEYQSATSTTGYPAYMRSNTGGVTWDPFRVTTSAQTDVERLAVWYDSWTPGNVGNLIHVAFLENGTDTIYYENINSSSQAESGEVAAYSDSATGRLYSTDNFSIARATDGDLYIASTSSAVSSTPVVRKSTDVGATWTTTSDEGLDAVQNDKIILLPLADADLLLIRWDISADDIQSKEYEDSTNAWDADWTTDQVDINAVDSTTYVDSWGATQDPSNFNVYLAYVNSAGGSADVKTATYNGSTWSSNTNVISATTSIMSAAIALDTTNGDIYVSYIRGSAGTTNTVYYKQSTDDMTSWSVERGPLVAIEDDMRTLHMNFNNDESIGVMTNNDDLDDLWFARVADIGNGDSRALNVSNTQGFESGDSVDAVSTSGTFSYASTPVRSGDYALRSNPVASTGYVDHPLNYLATAAADTATRDVVSGVVAFRIASTPAAETTIVSINSSGTMRFEIKLDTTPNINIPGTSGTYALSTDTWYNLVFVVNADTDVHEVAIYNSSMTTRHELLTSTSAILNFNRIRLGVDQTATTADLYFDDMMLYADNIIGNFPYFTGDHRIVSFLPTAVGSDTAWTNDYQNVDEIPTNTADYINRTGSGDETHNFESASSAGIGSDIASVRVMNTAWEASSCVTSVHAIRWNTGPFGVPESTALDLGTTVGTPYAVVANYDYTYIDFAEEATPLWSTATLDSAQLGIGSDSGTCEVRNGSIIVQVAYVVQNPPDFSGSLYSDEGSTKITSAAKTINLAVNGNTNACGGALCTAETSSGDWSISDVTIGAAGDVITVYVDDETENAVTVTRAKNTTSNMTGINLYQNHVNVRHEDAGPTTNANLDQYDFNNEESGDGDIGFTVTTNALTVSSGWELFVWTNRTHDPNGTVDTNATGGDLHIDDYGTAYLDTATSTIGLDVDIDTGAKLIASATATVNGDTAGGINAVGTLTVSGGTLTVGNSTDEDVSLNGGTLNVTGGTLTVQDDIITTAAGSAEDINITGGTVNITDIMDLNDTTATIDIGGGGGTADVNITNQIDMDGGTLTIDTNADVDITSSSGDFLVDGASSTVKLTDGSLDAGRYFRWNNGATIELRGGSHHTGTGGVNGTWEMQLNGGLTFSMISGNNPDGNGCNITSSNILVYNGGTLTTGTPTGGTLCMGTTHTERRFYDIESETHQFYNLKILENAELHSSSTQAVPLKGSMTINSGKTFTGNAEAMVIEGGWINNGSFTANTSTITLTGGDISGSSDTTFYNLSIGTASTTATVTVDSGTGLDDPIIANSLAIDTGDTLTIEINRVVTQQNGAGSFTLSGTINGAGRFDYQEAGAFPSGGTCGSGLTLRFDTTAANLLFNARTFDCNVEVYGNNTSRSVFAFTGTSVFNGTFATTQSGTGNTIADFDTYAQTNTEFENNFTIGANTTFEAASETLIFDSLTFTDNGTFNHNNGTTQMIGSLAVYITGSSDTVFYDINHGTDGVIDVDGSNDPVVMGTHTMNGALAALVVNTNRTWTIDNLGAFTWTLGAMDGSGIFVYQPSAAFPTTGVFSVSITLRFDSSQNSQTMSARSYNHVQVYGNNSSNSVTAAVGSYTIGGNLTTLQSGTGTTIFNMDTNDPSITINGNFTIGSNTTIDEGAGTTDLNGNLTKQATTTWQRNTISGTLLLSGSTLQTIDATADDFGGSEALNNLTITNNSGSDPQTDPSVKFLGTVSSYGTYTITTGNVKVQYDENGSNEVLNVNWNSPDANKIYFRSTSAGTQFLLHNYDSSTTINDVDVKDTYNAGTYVFDATDVSNVNSGNTYRWNFGSTLFYGTVYSNLTGTAYDCNANNLTINVSVNGDATPDSGTCSAANGTYSFFVTQQTGTDQHVAVYIDGVESVSATTATLTIAQYADITADLYIDYAAIDSQSGTTMTNTLLNTFDSGNDADIDYTVTSGNMTVTSGHGLYVLTNYAPGGTVTTPASSANAGTVTSGGDGDLVIVSPKILNMAANALSIGGDLDNNGTLTLSSGQDLTFTGTTTGFTIDRNTSVLQDVIFNGSGGGWSFTAGADIDGDLTMTAGTLSGTSDLYVGSQFTGSDIVCGGTCGTISMTGGTTYMYGAGDLTNDVDWTFSSLNLDHTTMNNYTTTANGSGKVTITGTLTLDDSAFPTIYRHSLDAGSKTWEFTGAVATPFDNRGRLIGSTSTFLFKNTGGVTIAAASTDNLDYYYDLTLQPGSSSSYSFTANTYYIDGDLTINSNTNLNPSTSEMYFTYSPTIDGGGQTLYDVTLFEMGAQTMTISNSDVTVSGTFTMSDWDTLSIDSGRTLTMSGPEIQIFGGNTISGLGTLRFVSGAGGPSNSGTISAIVRYDASNGDIAASTVDARVYGNKVEFYSNVTDTSRTIDLGAGTFTLSGASSHLHVMNYDNGVTPGILTVDGSDNDPTVNIGGDIDFPVAGYTGGESLLTGSGIWTASGNVDSICDWDLEVNNCISGSTGNTFIMDGTSKTLTSSTALSAVLFLYDVEFQGSTTLVGRMTAQNNLTVSGTFTSSSSFLSVGNGWTNNGTFNHGSGTTTFSGAAPTINGANDTTFYNLTISPSGNGTVTQQSSNVRVNNTFTVASGDVYAINTGLEALVPLGATLSLSGTISGAGTLHYRSATVFPSGGTISSVLQMNAFNTNQTMPPRTYGGNVIITCTDDDPVLAFRTVTVNASGTLTFSGNVTVTNAMCEDVSFDLDTNNPTTTIAGNLIIQNGVTFDAPPSLTLNGNYTQASSAFFIDNLGSVTLAGSSQQTLSGDMTGILNDFYDMTITNASGASPDVIFASSADVTRNFNAETAGTEIQFLAGGNYTLLNMTFNGQAAGTRIELSSSTPGTQWNLTADGTHSISYIEVQDSDACPSVSDIDASNGTNVDKGNNDCWIINTQTFAISDTSIFFGDLNPSSSCYAQGSDPGGACNGSEGEAHQLTAATNAPTGFVITMFGTTLTKGGDTITAIGGSNTAPAPGSEQFGIRMTASGGSGSVTAPYAASGFAYDGESSPDQVGSSATASATTTYSVRYLGNIAVNTEPGSYLTSITYVMTPRF